MDGTISQSQNEKESDPPRSPPSRWTNRIASPGTQTRHSSQQVSTTSNKALTASRSLDVGTPGISQDRHVRNEKKGGATGPPHSIRQRGPTHSGHFTNVNANGNLGSDHASGQSEAYRNGHEYRIELVHLQPLGACMSPDTPTSPLIFGALRFQIPARPIALGNRMGKRLISR
ncbi:hypothetical protein N7512_009249 [Penicillium capsulatum]|nr:hypothetical protein N7512_009249 [Penicillium capsulatum]